MMQQTVMIFFIFAFSGWIIELVFRSVYERHLVNPGFHRGPWLPVYGLPGVVIFLVTEILGQESILLRMLFYLVLCTAFEYLAGVFLERIFHMRLWDYSNHKFNLKGLICPLYSAGWVVIAVIVELYILPDILLLIAAVQSSILIKLDVVLLSVFTVDFLFSSGIAGRAPLEKLKDLFG